MDVSVLEQVVATHVPMVQRLNVPQFHRMLEQGILREGEPVELIDGLLIRKDRSDRGGDPMVHGPLHAFVITRLQRLGLRLGGLGCHLRCQLPVTLSDLLEPEPDAAIVRGERTRDQPLLREHRRRRDGRGAARRRRRSADGPVDGSRDDRRPGQRSW